MKTAEKGQITPAPASFAIRAWHAIDDMVHGLVDMPYRHPLYHANFRLTHEIRFVPVGNCNVFYAVMEESKTVEIRRVIYQRRDTRRM